MHIRQMNVILIALTLAAALAACMGGATPAGPSATATLGGTPETATVSAASALIDTEWVLTSLQGQPLVPGTQVSLRFERDRFSSFAGCNTLAGRYVAADPGTLSFPELERTMELCPEPEGVMEQEKAYLEALMSMVSYRLVADRLELRDASGEMVLVYARRADCAEEPANLAGTAWQLVSVDGREPAQGSATLLTFPDDKWFVEYSECEGYISSYQATGHDLSAGFSARLGGVCQDEEGHGVTALEVPADYCLAQGRLQITTVPGQVFVYEPLPEAARSPLEGPTWSLLSIVGARQIEGEAVPWPDPGWVAESTEITVVFAGGTASGSAGCNGYGAAYTLDGTSLDFGDIAATEKACLTPEGVMEQEQRYLGALKDVTDYCIYGTLLWLWTKDGHALAFSAQGTR